MEPSEFSCHPNCAGSCSECTPQVLCAACDEPINGDPSSIVDGDTVHTETCAQKWADMVAEYGSQQ